MAESNRRRVGVVIALLRATIHNDTCYHYTNSPRGAVGVEAGGPASGIDGEFGYCNSMYSSNYDSCFLSLSHHARHGVCVSRFVVTSCIA